MPVRDVESEINALRNTLKLKREQSGVLVLEIA